MLNASSLTVTRGSRTILDSIDLEVRPGELLALLGPNGAGKSTLLSVLAGEREPLRGSLGLEGRELRSIPVAERSRTLALLPQESRMDFAFTAFEVVLLGRTPHAFARGAIADQTIARAALRRTGTSHLAERFFPTLSGGERQRVQLARVLAQLWDAPPAGARYLFLDEPVSSLDPAHQHATLDLARRLSREGIAVVAVLHDLNLAAQYADRVALLHRGRLDGAGPPADVLTEASIERAYGLRTRVLVHPELGCPWVLPLGEPSAIPAYSPV
ncbi:heme ABC transporter ATP-binding protein [Vulgatibacter incomptus]|uniref:ABC-type hemin transport system, ATPase component n=1 Tax=Vulgatibacter incomptus TaxID=1391653 RepID=A0A0K1PBR8_9BACT|nr:heme ABC transporter ATP-binding protein [Vulgatibacter incomptus]AKU90970.1 ABC-type hemin transport system, ATPase component [Vulgatibacter incomptus]